MDVSNGGCILISLQTSENDVTTIHTISGNGVIMDYGDSPKVPKKQRFNLDRHKQLCFMWFFWARYLLFVINFLIMLTGFLLITIAAFALSKFSSLQIFQLLLDGPSCALVVCGGTWIIVCLCGCVGALRLNATVLKTFAILVVSIFLLQMVVGLVLWVNLGDISAQMTQVMTSFIVSYTDESGRDDDAALDLLQRQYQCCGASTYQDWDLNILYNCSIRDQGIPRCGVPSSCCRDDTDGQCGHHMRSSLTSKFYASYFIHTVGCIDSLMDIFQRNVVLIGAFAFCISFLQMCTIILANEVLRKINKLNKKTISAATPDRPAQT